MESRLKNIQMKKSIRMTFRATLAECVRKIKDFDVLGHLDYVVRYGNIRKESILIRNFQMRSMRFCRQ